MSPFWNLKFHLAKWQIHVPIIQLKLFLVGLIGRPVAVFNILTVLMQLRKHQELNKTQGQSPEHKDLLRLPISRYQVEVVAILFPLDPQSAIWMKYFSVPDLHWVSGKVWNGKWGGWIPTCPTLAFEDTFLWLGSFHILKQMGPLAASVKHTFYKADFRCWCTAEKHPCFNACGAITWDLWSLFGNTFCVRLPNLVIKPKNLKFTSLFGDTFFFNSSAARHLCFGQWEVPWKSYHLLSACFPEKNNASAQKQGSSWPPEGMMFNHVMCKSNPWHSSWHLLRKGDLKAF